MTAVYITSERVYSEWLTDTMTVYHAHLGDKPGEGELLASGSAYSTRSHANHIARWKNVPLIDTTRGTA